MILFFYGPNTYASRAELRRMSEAYLAKAGSDFGLERIDGPAANPKTLPTQLMAAPFLANSRLVIIDQLSANKPACEMVLKVLDKVPSTTVVIFYEVEPDQRTTWYKSLLAASKAVKFEMLTPGQLQTWIRREAAKLGAEIDRQATSELLEICGDDQWRLSGEIAKLAAYTPSIDVASVRALVTTSATSTIFDMVDAMTAGDQRKSIESYRNLLAAQANELYILSMIAWQLRNLLLAKSAGKISSRDLAKKAAMSPYVAEKMLRKQAGLSLEMIGNAYRRTIETDFAIKSGYGKADVLVEKLILDVATAAAK